jgi:hypothetical protein
MWMSAMELTLDCGDVTFSFPCLVLVLFGPGLAFPGFFLPPHQFLIKSVRERRIERVQYIHRTARKR